MKKLLNVTTTFAQSGSAERDSADHQDDKYWTPDNPEARHLAKIARQIARGQDVLFHGTQYRSLILATGMLKFPDVGSPCVSFCRSPDVAAYWATLPRDDGDGSGAIFVFDHPSLKTRYKVECHADEWVRYVQKGDECEEWVVGRDVEIAPHMIGLAASPIVVQSPKERAWKRACRMRIEQAASSCSCGARGGTCRDCLKERHDKTLDQFESAHPAIHEHLILNLANLSVCENGA